MKILLIEDDGRLSAAMVAAIRSAGFPTDASSDGQNAFLLISTEPYDLIVMDYFLPDMDGRKLTDKIRKAGLDIPILMISGDSSLENKLQAFEAGADDYITKPIDSAELIARIKALRRRPPISNFETYNINGIDIDFSKWKATKNGRQIKITAKEMNLLRFLLDNKNKVVSRSTIMDNVWDMNADPFSNTIETHIMKLRKNLGDRRRKVIQTVPGKGYMLYYPL